MKSIYFQTSREDFFIFCFAPCATVLVPCCTHMVISFQVLCRLCCNLFERVAAPFLSLPLKSAHLPSTPSLCFVQMAPAFLSSISFIDPDTCFSMFLHLLCMLLTLESCPYMLPHFSNLKQFISTIGVCAVQL